jgi:hypothetical protein
MTNPVITNVNRSILTTGDNIFQEITLAMGQVIVAGTALGVITADGEPEVYSAVDSTNTDGTQFVRAIAYADCDATAADTLTKAIVGGNVDASKVVFVNEDDSLLTVPTGTTDNYDLQLREFNIYALNYGDAFIEDNQ